MGITGHLLLASDEEIESLVQNPEQLYTVAPDEEPDLGFRLSADRFRQLADLSAMAWLLSGEHPGAPKPGPDRPIAFLTRGGTPKRIDARFWLAGPVLNVPEVRMFSLDELGEIAALVREVGEETIARKGGEPAAVQYRDLRDFLNAGVENELLLLITGNRCLLLSEAELDTATGSALRVRPRRTPPPHPWLDLESNRERHVDFDKLWDAMCRLLQACDSSADGTWALFERGGAPIGGEKSEGFGYGPARAYRSNEVARLSKSLSQMAETSLVANVHVTEGAYRVARQSPDDYVDLFRQLRTLLERGAASQKGMVAYFT